MAEVVSLPLAARAGVSSGGVGAVLPRRLAQAALRASTPSSHIASTTVWLANCSNEAGDATTGRDATGLDNYVTSLRSVKGVGVLERGDSMAIREWGE